jgi:plastocyanin
MNRFLFFIMVLFSGISLFAQQTFNVTASGLTFNPATVNAKVGDQVTFNVSSMHPVLQVSEATYLVNGNTALPGGFSYPSGSGTFNCSQAGTYYYICKNHISSGMKGKIIVSAATGISNSVSTSDFDMFPNPASDYIYLKRIGTTALVSAIVYDVSGKAILKCQIQNTSGNQSSVYVNELRKGLYFISVTYPDVTYTRKFIKL